MSNSLDTDQAQHFVGPDLGPKLSADDTSRQSKHLSSSIFNMPHPLLFSTLFGCIYYMEDHVIFKLLNNLRNR